MCLPLTLVLKPGYATEFIIILIDVVYLTTHTTF